MDRNDYYKILKNYPKFVLKKDLKSKQIINALKHIAPDIKENDLIALYDTSTLNNGKNGLLISKDAIYYGSIKTKISFKDMDIFSYREKSSYVFEIKARYRDGHEILGTVIYPSGKDLAALVLAIAGAYNTDTESTVTESIVTESTVTKSTNTTSSQMNSDELETIGENYYDNQDYEKAYQYLLQAANMNHPRAINMIGLMYQHGNYVEKNETTAFSWFQKAANLNYPSSFFNMGKYYRRVKDDKVNATKCFEKGAHLGHAGCQNALGSAYEYAYGVEQDYEKAANWYQKAADQNHGQACYNIGFLYKYGKGVTQDYSKSFYYYEKAANKGIASAQSGLGTAYLMGYGTEVDYKKAVYWYELSIQKDAEDKYVFYELGRCYYLGLGIKKNFEKSFTYFLKAAELGDDISQGQVGICYETGQGVKANLDTAIQWYKKAANNNVPSACANLARVYRFNYKNYKEAVYWYEKAIELGNHASNYQLGFMYENAEGVAQDYEKARSYYRQFVKHGKTIVNPTEAAKEHIEEAQKRIDRLTVLIYNKKSQLVKPETPTPAKVSQKPSASHLKKLPFSADLSEIKYRKGKLYNPMTLNEHAAIIRWSEKLGKSFMHEHLEEFNTFEDKILVYISQNSASPATRINACVAYLDRHNDIDFHIPPEVKAEIKKPILEWKQTNKWLTPDKEDKLPSIVKNHYDITNTSGQSLKKPKVDYNDCAQCGTCIEVCPAQAIIMMKGHAAINPQKCTDCRTCALLCPVGAIYL